MSPSTQTPPPVREIADAAALAAAIESPRAVLFKHSTRCPVSAYVIDEVIDFAETNPEWPVYVINVIEQRPLSNEAAKRLGVRHESPQAFVLRQGRVWWHGSHNEVTTEALQQQVGRA
jgi:bacillithiol system protein YtxJ